MFHSESPSRSTGSSGFLDVDGLIVVPLRGSIKTPKTDIMGLLLCVCLKSVFQFLSFMIIYPLCLDSLHPAVFRLCELIGFPSVFGTGGCPSARPSFSPDDRSD